MCVCVCVRERERERERERGREREREREREGVIGSVQREKYFYPKGIILVKFCQKSDMFSCTAVYKSRNTLMGTLPVLVNISFTVYLPC